MVTFFVAFFQLSSPEPNFSLSQAARELSPLSSGEGSSLRSPTASTVSQLSAFVGTWEWKNISVIAFSGFAVPSGVCWW